MGTRGRACERGGFERSDFDLPLDLREALREADAELRLQRANEALRRWVAADSTDGAAWSLHQDALPRATAAAAVVNVVATRDADVAIVTAREWAIEDPEHAEEYVHLLLFALGAAGAHERAADVVHGSGATDVDGVVLTFGQWSAAEPESALAAAVKFADATQDRVVVDAAIDGWSQTDPEGLAECASGFPPGPERELALVTALRAWFQIAPCAAANWSRAHPTVLATIPNTGHELGRVFKIAGTRCAVV